MNNYRVKNSFGLLYVLALILFAAGCSSKETNSNEETRDEKGVTEGKELVAAYNVEISNFDPIKGSSGGDHALLWPIYDTLISFTVV